jgi:adenylate cyclase
VAAGVLAVLLADEGVLRRWEYTTWDWRQRSYAKPTTSRDSVKIIIIDQGSLDWAEREYGVTWEWPRELYAAIVEFCRRGGARAVALDLILSDPSEYGVRDDSCLARAIARERPPPVVLPVVLSERVGNYTSWPPGIPRVTPALGMAGRTDIGQKAPGIWASRACLPIEEFLRGVTYVGNVAAEPGTDGVFRRLSLLRFFGGRAVPSLGLALYMAGDPAGRQLTLDGERLLVGAQDVPVDAGLRLILRFRGPHGTYETHSAAAILKSEELLRHDLRPLVDPETFRGCYVIVGCSALGMDAMRPSPLGPRFTGAEIHATLVDNLLSGDFLREVPGATIHLASLLAALLAASVLVLLEDRIFLALLLPIPLLAAPWLVSWRAYPSGLWWPVVEPTLAIGAATAGALVRNYHAEWRMRWFIEKTFRHYVSERVIEKLKRDPSRVNLVGERKTITVFFSDLAGFTSLSERMDPADVHRLLNEHMTRIGEIILKHDGTIDKFIGDAVMAFWNDPVDQEDHALCACKAAVSCVRALRDGLELLPGSAGRGLRVRIGINTGEAIVGNMGSKTIFDYTAIGDSVNLASRLEGANKTFGTQLLVSEDTWRSVLETAGAEREWANGDQRPEMTIRIGGMPETGTRGRRRNRARIVGEGAGWLSSRRIARVRVPGRQEPLWVYEVVEGKRPGWWEQYDEALEKWYGGNYETACRIFGGLEHDPAAAAYLRRRERSGDILDPVWSLTK